MNRNAMDRNAELEPTLQGVLENHSLPADLGRAVATKAFVKRFGSSLSRHRAPAVSAADGLPWFLVAALAGVLIGYVVLPQQGGLGNQLMLAQMFNNRGPWGSGGLGVMSSAFFPAARETLRVIFLIFLILFVTRSRVWKTVFPRRLPFGLAIAQWLALIAAMFGILRVLGSSYLIVTVFGDPNSLGQRSARDAESIVGITFLMDQIWWLTFSVASLTMLFAMMSIWAHHYWQADGADT